MSVVTTDAIILQAFPYGDTSRILRLLTRDHGVRSAIARGATRPKSRYSGLLELFTEGAASLYLKQNQELLTLSGFELIRGRQALGNDLMRFGGASLLSEIVLRTGSEEAQPALYDQLAAALDTLAAAHSDTIESIILAETWALVAALGFAPSLAECVSCARNIADDEDTRFSYSAGGALCADCRDSGGGSALPAHARAALAQMLEGLPAQLQLTAGHWSLLERYLDHHVLEGSALRSLAFLSATRRM
ncbi:MAG: DNA repair protein RecO [Longimicrobiales bacterium]